MVRFARSDVPEWCIPRITSWLGDDDGLKPAALERSIAPADSIADAWGGRDIVFG
jgi:hypothetical protein|tara:strand:+ start:189 stop:353 length:165 start_codon:yes stop_codon:yes gene_type:complete